MSNIVMDVLAEVVDGVKDETFYVVVAEFPDINYTLVRRNAKYEPWVAAWGLNKERKCWAQGHYFCTIEGAMQYIFDKQAEKLNVA